MTCIAAYRDGHKNIWMGGDSIGVSGYSYCTLKQPKVFSKNNMIFGFTTSFRMGQIIQYDLTIPPHHNKIGDFEYLVTCFIDSLQSTFSKKKYSKTVNSQESGGTFLFGYNQKIYRVEENFQIIEIQNNYDSVGCGEDFANATFWTLENFKTKISPENKVRKALECASKFSMVKEPFHILKLDANKGLNT